MCVYIFLSFHLVDPASMFPLAHKHTLLGIHKEGSIFPAHVCVCVCSSHSVMSDSLHPMDCSPPGSSVHGTLQTRILEWNAISFFRGSSQARDQTQYPALRTNALPSELPGKSLPVHMDPSKFLCLMTWLPFAFVFKMRCTIGKAESK